jgi:hypothetical protein
MLGGHFSLIVLEQWKIPLLRRMKITFPVFGRAPWGNVHAFECWSLDGRIHKIMALCILPQKRKACRFDNHAYLRLADAPISSVFIWVIETADFLWTIQPQISPP